VLQPPRSRCSLHSTVPRRHERRLRTTDTEDMTTHHAHSAGIGCEKLAGRPIANNDRYSAELSMHAAEKLSVFVACLAGMAERRQKALRQSCKMR